MSKASVSEMLLTIGLLVCVAILLLQIKQLVAIKSKSASNEAIYNFGRDLEMLLDKTKFVKLAAFSYSPKIKNYRIDVEKNKIILTDKVTGNKYQFYFNEKIQPTQFEESEDICIVKQTVTINSKPKINLNCPFALRGMNYFPGEETWGRMWIYWDEIKDDVAQDLKKAKSMGINSQRIFVGQPTDENIRKLKEFLSISFNNNILTIVTLDIPGFPCSYDVSYIDGWIENFKNDERILAWDIGNEPGLSDCNPSNELSSEEINVINQVANYIKSKDKIHKITVGLFQGNINKISQIVDNIDIVQFHFYDEPSPASAIDEALSLSKGKPVIIGEFGCMATEYQYYPGIAPPGRFCNNENGQRNFYQIYLNEIVNKKISGSFFWIFEEFQQPDRYGNQNTPTKDDVYFGLVKLDGRVTPAGDLVREYYTRPNNCVFPGDQKIETIVKILPIDCKEISLEEIIQEQPLPSPTPSLSLPVDSERITSCFGWRYNVVYRNDWDFHQGIDISVPYGSEVKAIADGEVVKILNGDGSVELEGYGNYVLLKHKINGVTYYSLYAHLKCNGVVVKVGDVVKKGDVIAYSGGNDSCKGTSTGNHLHFEIRKNVNLLQNTLNPCLFLENCNCDTTCQEYSQKDDPTKCPKVF
ncbi:MAG: peptidoglycan DD-metalloendopeptidase family protein [Candidatus Aenigmatarchaeota archaeon]